jgi:hypothetical protein
MKGDGLTPGTSGPPQECDRPPRARLVGPVEGTIAWGAVDVNLLPPAQGPGPTAPLL